MAKPPRSRSQRVRDPLHNLIEFGGDRFEQALWSVLQTRPFKRLRRVKQLGFSELVYPGATHTRLAHSIGVFHVARKLMLIIRRHLGEQDFDHVKAETALAAALVHDLGHGPMSHAFEDVGEQLGIASANHETMSKRLVLETEVAAVLNKHYNGCADNVASIIAASGPVDLYSAVVSSQFDADRLDYMQRDRLMTGTQHGAIDFEWLLANIEVGEVPYGVDDKQLEDISTFVLGPKAVHAAEAYVLGLFQLYPTVYFHKTTRGAEKLFSELLLRLIDCVRTDSLASSGLHSKHPLVRYARSPDNIEHFLALDDSVIWSTIANVADTSKDAAIQELAVRLRDRKLLKSYDLREKIIKKLGREKLSSMRRSERETAIEVERLTWEAQINGWVRKNRQNKPRILLDRADRAPYRRFEESKGPLNQIRIRGSAGLVDLGDESRVVKAIDTYRTYRAFVAAEDEQAVALIEGLGQ